MKLDAIQIAQAHPANRRRLARALGLPESATCYAIMTRANAHQPRRCGMPCAPGDGYVCPACAVRWGIR